MATGNAHIGKPAPDFQATAVVEGAFKEVKLSDYRGEAGLEGAQVGAGPWLRRRWALTPPPSPPPPPGKYVVLFFYPLDFTFVCPTEIIAFSEHAEDFRKLGCEVLGVSVDSQFTHLAWYEWGPAGREGGRGAAKPIPLQGPSCVFWWPWLNLCTSLPHLENYGNNDAQVLNDDNSN